MTGVIVKQCACGIAYEEEGWAELPVLPDTVTIGVRCVMRNCMCGSTIARLYCAACGAELTDDVTDTHVPVLYDADGYAYAGTPVCAPGRPPRLTGRLGPL